MEKEVQDDSPENVEKSDRLSLDLAIQNDCNNELSFNLDASINSDKEHSLYDSNIIETNIEINSIDSKNHNNFLKRNNQFIHTSLNKINSTVFDSSLYKNIKSKEKPNRKWYSAFTFTYKQKNEDFKRLFKELPAEERLLVDYACALQKEILAQGRLYISLNYVCFYAYILGWETNLSIRLRDIKSIQKDKTVKFIPNAITLVLENDKHFFTSFASRDRTYATLYKMWQIAMLEQSIDNEEINTLVKGFYGEDLGYNSDDDDYEYYSKGKLQKISANNSADQQNLVNTDNQNFYMNSNNSSINKMSSYNENTNCMDIETSSSFSMAHNNEYLATSNSNKNSPVRRNTSNIYGEAVEIKNAKELHEDFLDNTKIDTTPESSSSQKQEKDNSNSLGSLMNLSNEIQKLTSDEQQSSSERDSSSESAISIECNCKEHIGKELLNKTYNMSVNNLFECMFGPTEFCLKFWESRKFFDMKIGEWKIVDNVKARRLEYFVSLNSPVAVKQCKNIEDQKLLQHISNKSIVVESASVTHGVPYSDTFAVACRYCITRVDRERSNFKVHGYIKYSQKPMFMVKAFIEKNAMGALYDAYQYLDKQFSEISESKKQVGGTTEIMKTLSNKNKSDNSKTNHSKNDKTKRNFELINRKRSIQASENNASANANTVQSKPTHLVSIQTFSFFRWTINVDTLVRLFIIAMLCLMIINGMLYLKLRRIEILADGLRNDPQISSKYQKIDIPSKNLMQNLEFKDNSDPTNWKELILKTMDTIEKLSLALSLA